MLNSCVLKEKKNVIIIKIQLKRKYINIFSNK